MLQSIVEVAARAGFSPDRLIPYGRHFAKIDLDLSPAPAAAPGKLILVTAITPTNHGEGKTVTAIGLAQAMHRLGRRVIVTLRQPSMGPVFGMKGGATGGGLSKVEPSESINLHFTGDFHAITSAHNLLSAMIEAHLHHGNQLGFALDQATWPRTMDMNDRALRQITVGIGPSNGPEHAGRFVITAASEIMAVMALAASREDLRRRLDRIVAGWDTSGRPVTAAQLGCVGSMMVLLKDALLPNLAQTTEGVPALIHCGPFANIAHGTCSILAQRLAVQHAEYAINEAGFGSDLGAEKFFDIVMRSSGIAPAATVVVASVRAMSGEGGLRQGLENLGRHLDNVLQFGVPAVVAINRFPTDSAEDLRMVAEYCDARGVPCALSDVFARGGEGGLDLARKIIEAAESGKSAARSLYPLDQPLARKIECIATRVYGAAGVEITPKAQEKLDRYERNGFGGQPVCIAKTPLSLSDDPKLTGAPRGFTVRITDADLSAGAGFVVAVSGATVRMPGLGHAPQALRIDLAADGTPVGLQ